MTIIHHHVYTEPFTKCIRMDEETVKFLVDLDVIRLFEVEVDPGWNGDECHYYNYVLTMEGMV